MRKEKFLKRKSEEPQLATGGEAFAKEAVATEAEGNCRGISTAGTRCPLVGSDRGLPLVKCVSPTAVTSSTLAATDEKYETEKRKNEALEDEKMKYKQNMDRMKKIVVDYKKDLDKARKDLKEAKGKK